MSTIADKLTQLNTIKGDIKTAINNKGGSVGDDFSTYAGAIDNLSTGSGETHTNPDFYELRTRNGTNFDHLFRGYSGPDIDVSKWDTSKVTSAQYCFANCTKSMDISNWDLSSLTNASYMFDHYTNNSKYMDLSVFDFSNVTNTQYMFTYSNTDYLDVRNIKLPKVTSYGNLFAYCSGTELDLSAWDISKVTYMGNVFNGANFTKIDLTGWKTTNVTNMGYMFSGYSSQLTELIIPDWDMTNATYTSSFIDSNSKLKYIDLSRSNELTIKKIASFLPKKTATTYGEVVIPSDTSQDAIDALMAKYWKPVGPKFNLNSTELVFELDEIKPGKTTKVWTGNSDPWYGDDRLETIEFISSDESIATINGREIIGVSEGTVDIICRRREDGIELGSGTLSVTYIDSNPNLIKVKMNGKQVSYSSVIQVDGSSIALSRFTKDPITDIYSYDHGKQITSIMFSYVGNCYVNEIVKFNFNESNITNTSNMFSKYLGSVIDISDWDTSKVTSVNYMFDSDNITTVIGALDLSNINNGLNSGVKPAFYDAINIETLYLKNIYKNSTIENKTTWGIYLDNNKKLKDECLIYIINELPNLYDKGLTATDKIKLTLPPTNTLTREQVQPAIDKGWTVVNTTY